MSRVNRVQADKHCYGNPDLQAIATFLDVAKLVLKEQDMPERFILNEVERTEVKDIGSTGRKPMEERDIKIFVWEKS